nr:MAG TPA: hypothetical protein [Caudoviricetes sp.]
MLVFFRIYLYPDYSSILYNILSICIVFLL